LEETLQRSNHPQRFPLAVIGAGALGLCFAARLAQRMPVAVIARTGARAAELRAGVRVGDDPYRADAYAQNSVPEADWAILLVKADDTEAAARTALALKPRGVLSLQNGLIDTHLRQLCAPLLAMQGVTTQGAYRKGDRIIPVGEGETLVGPGFEPLADLLNQAGMNARVESDIQAARMEKLLVSLAINPLTAVYKVPNGAVLDAPLRAEVEKLVREAWPVLQAEGLRLTEEEALTKVLAVADATAANRSSMLQDVRAGRRTEADYISGAFIKIAAQRGAAVPTHRALYIQVKRLETPTI
jgi:2-dehydropantoate 2-reductase